MVELVDTTDLKSVGLSRLGSSPGERTNLGVKMKNEADFKRIFKNSIRQIKGFSMSLAAPMISGIPDLYSIVPTYAPVMLEAKWFGKVTTGFSRKIPYSPLQANWLKEICSVNPHTAFGLVGFEWRSEIYAVLVPAGVETLSFDFEDLYPYGVYSRQSKTFDLTSMFEASSIPRINQFREEIAA